MKRFDSLKVVFLFFLLPAWGCGTEFSNPIGEGDGDLDSGCTSDSDCPTGETCADGGCVLIPGDEEKVELDKLQGDSDPSERNDREFHDKEMNETEEREGESPADADVDPDSEQEEEGEQESREEESESEHWTEPAYPPDNWGPYSPGEMDFPWRDFSRGGLLGKDVATKVWYPAIAPPPGTAHVRYLALIEGQAYGDILPDRSGGPYPLVLFSHGNKGINFQSFSFTTLLASHGFIVAAPNHAGNTIFDDPSDEEVGQIALDRPIDMDFVRQSMQEVNEDPTSPLYQMIDLSRVGITGHSFGGYTTVLLAGATVNVDEAGARCAAGTEADIFCPYIGSWPAGETVSRPPACADIEVAVAMAPGGYAAFGDDGLSHISMPILLMGGTLDEFLRPELRPLYAASPAPKVKVEITGMGHMGFTDICRLPGVSLIPTLGEMCDPDVYIDLERGWAIINPFAIAFLRLYLKDERALEAYLTSAYASNFPEVIFESQWRP